MAWNHVGGSHLLATASVKEFAQKEHQRELERIAEGSADTRAADFTTYVIVPLFLLICAMVAVRKVFTF